MTAYLAYSYSTCLTEKEQAKIDKKVKKNQEEFSRGFRRGTQISLSIYSVYLLARTTAHAVESCPDPGQVAPPANNGGVQPPANNGGVQPAPQKPGFKPLSEGTKGAFVGGASAICGAALQSGDFYLGIACATLLVIGGIVINRPHN